MHFSLTHSQYVRSMSDSPVPPTDDTHEVKHVPEWFPGSGFKQFAKEARAMFDIAVDGPLEYVKESLKVDFCDSFVLALIVPTRPMAATLPSRRRVSIVWPNYRTRDSTRATFER